MLNNDPSRSSNVQIETFESAFKLHEVDVTVSNVSTPKTSSAHYRSTANARASSKLDSVTSRAGKARVRISSKTDSRDSRSLEKSLLKSRFCLRHVVLRHQA